MWFKLNFRELGNVEPDIRIILGAVAQLERDILIERVKNGLANAKAKGVQLGRKKTRDSDLIRRLYLTGVTYREIGRIAKCSSGAVTAEVRQLKKELDQKQDLERALREREYESVKVELERTRSRVATLEDKVPNEYKSVAPPQLEVHPLAGEPINVVI